MIPELESNGSAPLCGTVNTKSMKVDYFIRCQVKFGSIFETGQGKTVEFPLIILSKPPADDVKSNSISQNFVNAQKFDHEEPSDLSFFTYEDQGLNAISEPRLVNFSDVETEY